MDKNSENATQNVENEMKEARKRIYAGFRAGWLSYNECAYAGDVLQECEYALLMADIWKNDFIDGWLRGWRAAYNAYRDRVQKIPGDDLVFAVALSMDKKPRDTVRFLPLDEEQPK